MNCEDMTDFEIAKAASDLWLECDYLFDEDDEVVYLVGYQTYLGAYGVADERLDKYGEFNPVKDAGDAWPIIIKNKISIMNDGDLWEASIDFDGDLEKHGTDEVLTKHYEHKNPLRAAMVVFLMMQDML